MDETKIVVNSKIEKGEADYVLETEDGDIGLTFAKKENAIPERQTWGGELEFILTCVGYAVGLGNVWRFPYLCFKNGGGAFLIPYVIMIAIIGLPLFFLEFAFGQFASLGPITIWSICPLFKGIGYSMVLLSWILGIYYIVIVAHCMFFLGSSFTNKLPWSDCKNVWNTINCGNSSTPAQEFFNNYVLEKSDSIDDFGVPSWKLSLCLLACWILVCFALIRGVQSLGKVAYFTAIFPYFVLTTLLIKSFFSEGALNGIFYYIKPEWKRLLSVNVWVEAATQIFFSLSVGNGGLIAMSSFNRFKNNCYRDAFLIVLINCGTSIFAGFVIFANLGIMAKEKNVTISQVASGGPGLVFEVYPEALAKFPGAPAWSVIFFLMMFTLGMGSELSTVECVLTGVIDELTKFKIIKTKMHAMIFRVVACSLGFLLGLPFICNGGNYFLNLIDTTLSGYPLLCIAFSELIVVSYIYGFRQFKNDIAMMIGKKPNFYWISSWAFTTPLVTFGLIVSSIFSEQLTSFPIHWKIFSHVLSIIIVSLIPIFFLYKYCREGGLILLKEFLKPVHEWGPAHENYRKEFIEVLSKKKGKSYDGNSTLNINNPLGLDELDSTHSFFQSKLSIADKMASAHTKQILKRTGADMNSPEAIACLTASQSAIAGQSQQRLAQMMAIAMSSAADVGNAQLEAEKKKVQEAAKDYEDKNQKS